MAYNENKIQELLSQISGISSINNNEQIRDALELLKSRVFDDAYKIVVVGEFSSGKSTFINAVIGRDILTHAKNETTATITYIHNVKKGSDRENTAVVNLMNGETKRLATLNELRDYTTAQSELMVVDRVASVDVYVNFMTTEKNIVIVDTPGLNGIADKHRMMTINEVQKSHACIYLMQLRGLTSTDIEFIKLLRKYQSTFIFVQNFIDELKESEGETVDGKLETCRRFIEENIDAGFDARYCGISALKELVGRDKSIKRLYGTSEEELTDEDRKHLIAESGFADFNAHISAVVNDEEFANQRYKDDCYAIAGFIDDVLEILEGRQAYMQTVREKDERSTDTEELKQRMLRINERKQTGLKKLNNYLVSQFAECRKNLIKSAGEDIKQAVEELNDFIDELKTYEEVIAVINTSELHNRVNLKCKDILSRLKERKQIEAQYIYKLVLVRMDEYCSSIGDVQPINFTNSGIDAQTFSTETDEQELRKMRTDASVADVEINRNKQKIESSRRDKQKEDERLNKSNENKHNIELVYDSKIKKLGSKPNVEPKRREVNRGFGILGKIADALFGKKSEPYTDDTKLRKWKKDKAAIEKEMNEEKMKINEEIKQINERRKELDIMILELEAKGKTLSRKQLQRKDDIKNKEEEIRIKKDNMKNEYARRLRTNLKNDVNKYFYGGDGDDGMEGKIKDSIADDMDSNTEILKKVIEQEYVRRYNERIKALQAAISGNEKELEKIYTDYGPAIKELNKIQKKIEEEMAV